MRPFFLFHPYNPNPHTSPLSLLLMKSLYNKSTKKSTVDYFQICCIMNILLLTKGIKMNQLIAKLNSALLLSDGELRPFLVEWRDMLQQKEAIPVYSGPSIIDVTKFVGVVNKIGGPVKVTFVTIEQVRINGLDIEFNGDDFKDTLNGSSYKEFQNWAKSNFSANELDSITIGTFLQALVGNTPDPELLAIMANHDNFIIDGLTEQQQVDIFMNWNLFVDDNTVFDHMSDCIEYEEGDDS